jgi:hypothetical protein
MPSSPALLEIEAEIRSHGCGDILDVAFETRRADEE